MRALVEVVLTVAAVLGWVGLALAWKRYWNLVDAVEEFESATIGAVERLSKLASTDLLSDDRVVRDFVKEARAIESAARRILRDESEETPR